MRSIEVGEYTFLLGKNAEENDKLINQSDPNHIWFHLANLPSCHGVINCTIEQLTNNMRYVCGSQLKKYTKYKSITGIYVNYTQVKNIETTKKPGLVNLIDKPKKFKV